MRTRGYVAGLLSCCLVLPVAQAQPNDAALATTNSEQFAPPAPEPPMRGATTGNANTAVDSTDAVEQERANRAFALMHEGLQARERGDWERARDKLEQAWSARHFPNIAFHLALVYDHLGDYERMQEKLEFYWTQADETNPNFSAARTLSNKPKPKPKAPPAATAVPQASEVGTRSAGPAILMGSGAVLLVASITTGLLANAAESELSRNCDGNRCPERLRTVSERGETLELVTNILLATGGLAVLGGAGWGLGGACSKNACSAFFSGEW